MTSDFERTSDFCFRHGNYFVKVPGEGQLGHGDTLGEYNSYQLIKDYVKTPRVRLLNHRDPPWLVVQKVEGVSLADRYEPRVFEKFVDDLGEMWKSTVRPMEEDQLTRNHRVESLRTLEHFRGTTGELDSLVTEAVDNLTKKRDPVMVISHGDEHWGNIFSDGADYRIIDPRNSGWQSPAGVFNIMLGSACLFQGGRKNGEFEKLLGYLNDLSSEEFLTKEYLFANMLRGVVGRVNPRNLEHVMGRREENLLMAIDFYENGL